MINHIRHALSKITGGPSPYVSPASHHPRYRSLDLEDRRTDTFRSGTLVFALPPVAKGSGGIADILHLGQELHASCDVAVSYLLPDNQSHDEAVANLKWACPDLRDAQLLPSLDWAPEFLCATAAMTVYRALELPAGKKLYFVQDHEPSFYAAGVEKYYIEHTYRFGLPRITLGPWLASVFREEAPDEIIGSIPFPFSGEHAQPGNKSRDTIMIYIQPDKKQRGSELLIETARMLAGSGVLSEGGYRLQFFGSRINEFISFEFPCEVRGVLSPDELSVCMQHAVVGLCASFTNISLLPFRFIAHGAMAVDLDLPGVRMNIPDAVRALFKLARPDAASVAAAVLGCLREPVPHERAVRSIAKLAESNGWTACGGSFREFMNRI